MTKIASICKKTYLCSKFAKVIELINSMKLSAFIKKQMRNYKIKIIWHKLVMDMVVNGSYLDF